MINNRLKPDQGFSTVWDRTMFHMEGRKTKLRYLIPPNNTTIRVQITVPHYENTRDNIHVIKGPCGNRHESPIHNYSLWQQNWQVKITFTASKKYYEYHTVNNRRNTYCKRSDEI